MTEQDVFRRVHEIDASDHEKLIQFASDIATECREPARTVLQAWRDGPPNREACCAFVLRQLEELAVAEMLLASESAAPAVRVQLMEMVVAEHLVLREYLLTVLKPLLDSAERAESNEDGDQARICDAAYLLVRELVPVDDADVERFSPPSEFVAAPEHTRDEEIEDWKYSKTWTAVFPNP